MESTNRFIRFLFILSFLIMAGLSFSIYQNWESYQNMTPPSIWFDDPLFELSFGSRPNNVELYERVILKDEGIKEYSLDDLEKFTKMEYLKIDNVSNEMVKEIAMYPSIIDLEITINDSDLDLTPLQKLPKLRTLKVSGGITKKQMKAIIQMDSLDQIIFWNVRMEGNIELSDFSKSDSIILKNVRMETLEWIECFPQLKQAYMTNVFAVSLDGFYSISNLKQLELISLCDMKVEELGFINELKNLDSLELNNIYTSDISEIRLNELPKLKEVKFDETIENENQNQIQKFRENLEKSLD